MKKIISIVVLLAITSAFLTACGGGSAAPADLLADIKQRGYIIISTDPNYAPQSFLNTEGKRPSDTKCPSDTLTTAEMQGFDVDVAIEIGTRLGVETCFATPAWDLITAGNWADKWDISVGSMGINLDRQKVVDFASPYYYTPAYFATLQDSGITSIDQLANQAVCVGVSTTYESWLNGVLKDIVPANTIYAEPPAGITIVPLDTDQECAQSLASGRKDFIAYLTSETVIDSNIAEGMPVVKLGKAVFSDACAPAIDKAHTLPIATLLKAVDDIVIAMHSDGTLSQMSIKWFGTDTTIDPSTK